MAKSSKAVAKVHTPEVMEPENPEVALVRTEVSGLSTWAQNALAFFHRANELELSAKALLSRVEGLTVPSDSGQDRQITDIVRLANAGKKDIEQHWTITSVLDRLHKRAVQGRKRGTDAYDRAAQIGTNLHNQFTEAEKRRAREEEDRIRREREEEARQKRQRELDQLEAEAIKAESSSPDLSEREKNFLDYYKTTHNAPQAARMAGYKNHDSVALQLLGRDKIKRAIEAAETAAKAREQAAAIKESPVEVVDVTVRPDINGGDVTTWAGRILDENAVIDAFLQGKAPRSLISVNPVAVNVLARQLHENLDRIPGLQHVKTTRVR